MAAPLKTNTAVTIALGPFVDATDGVTPETALTVASTAVTVIAETDDNSAPTLVLDSVAGDDATNTLAHITGDGAGYYSYKLTAANVNRLGRLSVCAIGAAHAPVFREFVIKPANIYDSEVLGTDYQQVDLVQVSGATEQLTGFAKGVAVTKFMVYMELTAGGPATGKTLTVQVAKDGGAFATTADSATEISGGWYEFDLSGTEMNANFVAIKITATSTNQRNILIKTTD